MCMANLVYHGMQFSTIEPELGMDGEEQNELGGNGAVRGVREW